MARFLNRPLALLDRIFKFDGAKRSTDQLDLEAPIALVCDVGQYARAGVGQYLGLMRYDGFHDHNAANSIKTEISTYQILVDLGLVPDAGAAGPGAAAPDVDFWVWFMAGAMRTSSVGNFSAGNFTRQSPGSPAYPVQGSVSVEQAEIILGLSSVTEAAGYTGVGTVYPVYADTFHRSLPMLLYPGDNVGVRSLSTGITDVYWSAYLWIGRAGTAPPP